MVERLDTRLMARGFAVELRALDDGIARMGGLTEEACAGAIAALERRDREMADLVVLRDKDIDALEKDLETLALAMISRRQPMARDLRQVFAALKISADLERVGDLAKNTAKRASAIADETFPTRVINGLKNMAHLAQTQMIDVLDAYVSRDHDLARRVWQRDAELDVTYNSVYAEILQAMRDEPDSVGVCTHLLFSAKNLERIGDHATNIAETVHFLVTGHPLDEDADRPKSDTTSTRVMTREPAGSENS